MKKKYSLKQRIRYMFDNIMNRGMMAEILLLFIITIIFILLMGIIVAVVTGTSVSLVPWGMWMTLLHTLDPGTVSGTEGTVLFIALMVIATFYGLLFTAILIGLINDGISEKMKSLAKGRGPVLEKGHTLILGFNDATMTLLQELIQANQNQKTIQPVVIMDDLDASEMEEQIRLQLGESGGFGKTAIICRRGLIYDIHDLERCAIRDTRSVIINAENDFNTIKTILASTYILDHSEEKSDSYAVAVVFNDENEAAAEVAGNYDNEETRLVRLMLQKTLARIMVHTSRQSGLSVVFTEIFNFAGMEFYLLDKDPAFSKLTGKTIRKINHFLKTAIAVGVYRDRKDVLIGPPDKVEFQEGDKLLVLEEDDDPLVVEEHEQGGLVEPVLELPGSETYRVLIIGIFPIINNILHEYANYLQAGSIIYVVNSEKGASECIREDIMNSVKEAECTLKVEEGIDIFDLTKMNNLLKQTEPDSVLLLLDHDKDPEEEDEKVMKLLLYLRHYREKAEHKFNITSEINLARDQKLANATGSDDFIISRQISALLMAQISQKKEMKKVFSTLLSSKGFEIYIKKALNYVPKNKEIDAYTILEAVAKKNEIWIGIRKKNGNRYDDPVINPAKYDSSGKLIKYRFGEEDYFVVLAEDISFTSETED